MGQETGFAYDGAGRLVRTTGAVGDLLQYAYDSTGNFMSQASTEPSPSPSATRPAEPSPP